MQLIYLVRVLVSHQGQETGQVTNKWKHRKSDYESDICYFYFGGAGSSTLMKTEYASWNNLLILFVAIQYFTILVYILLIVFRV